MQTLGLPSQSQIGLPQPENIIRSDTLGDLEKVTAKQVLQAVHPALAAFVDMVFIKSKFILTQDPADLSYKFFGPVRPTAIKKMFGEKFQQNLHKNSVVVDPMTKERCMPRDLSMSIMVTFDSIADIHPVMEEQGQNVVMEMLREGAAAFSDNRVVAISGVNIRGKFWNRAALEDRLRDDVLRLEINMKGWPRPGVKDADKNTVFN